jgi:cytochrome c-type biogenesis protein
MDWSLLIPSFIAGILMFFAPCTLPLIPAYIGIISGTTVDPRAAPGQPRQLHWSVVKSGLFFAIGFTLVFLVLGTIFSYIGTNLIAHRPILTRIGGACIIAFGVIMLGSFNIPFFRATKRFPLPKSLQPGKPLSAFIVGLTFGFGWSPCIGPILGTVLFLASTSATALSGMFLMLIFSLGITIPFLIVALVIGHAWKFLAGIRRAGHWITGISGIFLIGIGILLLTNSFSIWLDFFYRLFSFINFDSLLKYL